jgi:rhodanese-related sulfurtransferase
MSVSRSFRVDCGRFAATFALFIAVVLIVRTQQQQTSLQRQRELKDAAKVSSAIYSLTASDLDKILGTHRVKVIDARSSADFLSGHVIGAVSYPLDERPLLSPNALFDMVSRENIVVIYGWNTDVAAIRRFRQITASFHRNAYELLLTKDLAAKMPASVWSNVGLKAEEVDPSRK